MRLLEIADELLWEQKIIKTTGKDVHGNTYKTGKPVTFPYRRNTTSSTNYNIPSSRFQQHIEPAGRYMNVLTVDPDDLPPAFETGEVTFENPLVIPFNTEGGGYDENSWKYMLYMKYNERNEDLSKALRSDGYDGIVTVNDRENYPLEIVDISMF